MARRTRTLPLGMPVAPPERAKARWVVEALRVAIREGRVVPGSRVPSTRDLAGQWGVSRGLVSAAYEELQGEGLLESAPGSGTYVRAGAVDPQPDGAEGAPPRAKTESGWIRVNPERPFIARETDVTQFPIGVWKRLAQRVLSEADTQFFYDPDPAGSEELRVQVARYLGFARGIRCDPDDILITTGTRHSLDLCLRCLARPGDRVWTESPGYAGAEALIRSHGLTAVPVPVDTDGFQVEIAEAIAPEATLCLLTPSHQSPLGVRLSLDRRTRMLAWAARRDAYIVEDDYDGEFVFEPIRVPAFKAMDAADRIIHAGSFNKSLFPTLRIGYMVVPRAIRARMRTLRADTGRGNGTLDQGILSRFIAEGHFAQHIRRMERVYKDKCAQSLEAIRQGYGGPLGVLGAHGGFHFFLRLPDGLDAARFEDNCRHNGLILQTAALHGAERRETGIVVGYSSLTSETIDRAGTLLGRLLRAG
ncbi:PLP-dependent aminotransferase family protein [Methylobacterium sp. J-048]|uniref:MocR-like pyridoxine biosynthesis transcription factor PdxR n=1 Tax=Methylobacterium sp. J-048 TaxID=2836635 RepID=UPI001FBACA87|nr:PLP-dependent aminotransferase family protein [Methylobacterium sp. J-048]MCJ2060370.1 PLP-dependent aminotransferase family protein [Methylobacterium sp. J-048]